MAIGIGVAATGSSASSTPSSRSPSEPGVLLLDTSAGCPKPLTLLTGHSEPAAGLAIISGTSESAACMFGCWGDGAMLVWDLPPQESSNRQRCPSPPARLACRAPSPTAHTCRSQRLIADLTPPSSSGATLGQRSRCLRSTGEYLSPAPTSGAAPSSQVRKDCQSAPPAPSFLERLLPTPPPKWAGAGPPPTTLEYNRCGDDAGLGLPGFSDVEQALAGTAPKLKQQQSSPQSSPRLGKWARGSMVGAQVRSASQLDPHELSIMSVDAGAGSGRVGPSGGDGQVCSSSRMLSQSLGMQVGGSFPSSYSFQDLRHPDKHTEAGLPDNSCNDTQRPSSTADSSRGAGQRRPLRPLPPKPRCPPPDLSRQPLEGKVQPEDKYRHARHINAIVRELRKREATPVLLEVARALLAACEAEGGAETTSENDPTAAQRANKEGTESSSSKIQLDFQRLCDDAAHRLPKGADTAEVGALLRRVGVLLDPDVSDTAGC